MEQKIDERLQKAADECCYRNHAFARESFIEGANWQNKENEKNYLLLKEWFEEIEEKCSRLSTGNVSHMGATIRGLAKNCAAYIKTDMLLPTNIK